jgi:hypothetical protein
LLEKAFNRIFPSGKADIVYIIFSRSLEVISKTFQRNIYGLRASGFPIEIVEPLVSDLLAIT